MDCRQFDLGFEWRLSEETEKKHALNWAVDAPVTCGYPCTICVGSVYEAVHVAFSGTTVSLDNPRILDSPSNVDDRTLKNEATQR